MIEQLVNKLFGKYSSENWISALFSSVLIFAICILIHFIVFRVLKSINKKDKEVLRRIQKKFKAPSLVFLLTIAANIVAFLFTSSNLVAGYINQILTIALIFSISWLLIRFIGLGKFIVLRNFSLEAKDNLDARKVHTQFRIIERILIFVVVLIASAIALMTFEGIRQIGVSIFASAGVAGIILGFAAQKMIGTVLAGFQIALTQPIRIDDVVVVENEWGRIEEITLTYVVIRIWDKRRLVVPTTQFIEKPFQNWTRVSADILGTVFIYADYSVPFDEVRNELTRILKDDKNWDGEVNVLQVTNSSEKTVEMRALMSAVDSPTAWDLRVNVREKLIEFLQKNYPESLPRTRLSVEKDGFDHEGTM